MDFTQILESLGIKADAKQSKALKEALEDIVKAEKKTVREAAENEIADIKKESEEKISDIETELEEANRKLREEETPEMTEEEEEELQEYVARQVAKKFDKMQNIVERSDAAKRNKQIMEALCTLVMDVYGMNIVTEANKMLGRKLRSEVKAIRESKSARQSALIRENRQLKRQLADSGKALRIVGDRLVNETKQKIFRAETAGLSKAGKNLVQQSIVKMRSASLKEFRQNVRQLAEGLNSKRTKRNWQSTVSKPVNLTPGFNGRGNL